MREVLTERLNVLKAAGGGKGAREGDGGVWVDVGVGGVVRESAGGFRGHATSCSLGGRF